MRIKRVRIFGASVTDEEAAIGVVVNGGKFVASEHGWVYENGQIPDFNDTPLNFLPVVRGGSGGNTGGLHQHSTTRRQVSDS